MKLNPTATTFAAAFFAVAVAGLAAQAPRAGNAPPVAPVRPVVDVYFGTKVSDPYRYMENLKDPKVEAWFRQQGAYTQSVLASIPGQPALVAEVLSLSNSAPARVSDVQRLPGEVYFYMKRAAGENVAKLYMRRGLTGNEKLLMDPGAWATPGGPHYVITDPQPSPDGRYVAVKVSPGGSENAVIHIFDTTTMKETGETIDRARFATPSWNQDSKSFYYTRLPKLGPGAPVTEQEEKATSYLHVVGTSAASDRPVFGYGLSPSAPMALVDDAMVFIDPGVRFAFGVVIHGTLNEATIYTAPLAAMGHSPIAWKKLCDVNDDVTSFDVHGDDVYLLTHKQASNFKIIHTRLSAPNLAQADTIVAPSAAVILGLSAAQDALYVQTFSGGLGGLLRIPYGGRAAAVKLPFAGSLSSVISDQRIPGVLFDMESWTSVPRLFIYDPKTGQADDTKLNPLGPHDNPADLVSEEVQVRSYDGVMVPLSITYKKGLKRDGSNPTLLVGYGSYGISELPSYNPQRLAWFERGGIYAVAHVRGGGENGDDWYLAGKGPNKPNTWKDFIAAAEYLVAQGYTRPSKLGALGGSAGGILIGRAITERPDLFAAVVDEVPASDMLRMETTANGVPNIPEFGSVKTEAGFHALYEMSPYEHVVQGAKYPAVLLTTGYNDPRVDSWQAGKMAARLQAATGSGRPVLLKVDFDAGHGGIGATNTQTATMNADIYSFLLWQFASRPAAGAAPVR